VPESVPVVVSVPESASEDEPESEDEPASAPVESPDDDPDPVSVLPVGMQNPSTALHRNPGQQEELSTHHRPRSVVSMQVVTHRASVGVPEAGS
jgi:hypothetical protein